MPWLEALGAPLLFGGALTITALVLYVWQRRLPPVPAPAPELGGDLLAGSVGLFLLVMIANLGLRSLLFPDGIETTPQWLRFETLRHLPILGLCAATLWKLGRIEGDPVGVRATGLLKRLIEAALLYALLLVPFLAVHEACRQAVLDGANPQQGAVDHLKNLQGPGLVLFTVLVAVITPLFEELVFRGLMLSGLRAVLRGTQVAGEALASVVVSTAFFTIIHPQFTWGPIAFIALVLGVMRLRRASLWLVVAVHGFHNLATVLFHLQE